MNKSIGIVIFALGLISCTKASDGAAYVPKEICFGTAASRSMVGGTETYLRSNGFEVMAFDSNDRSAPVFSETAVYDISKGSFRLEGRYWPQGQNSAYDFFAASPADATNIRFACVGGEPQLIFNGNGSASRSTIRTTDVIVSSVFGRNRSNSGTGVTLEFEHILSCLSEIKFRMEDDSMGLGAVVSQIDISEPYGYTFHFNSGPGSADSYWTRNSGSGGLSTHSWSGVFEVTGEAPAKLVNFPEMLLIPCNRYYSEGPYYDISVSWTYFDVSSEETLGEGYGCLYGLELPPGMKSVLTITLPTASEMSAGADIYIERYNEDSINDIVL